MPMLNFGDGRQQVQQTGQMAFVPIAKPARYITFSGFAERNNAILKNCIAFKGSKGASFPATTC